MPAEAVDKAKALLKFGSQAMCGTRFKEAEGAFRQAVEIARSEKAERLHARAVSCLMVASAYTGRLDELREEVFTVMKASLDRFDHEPVAAIVLQSCALRFIVPEKAGDLVKMVVEQAEGFRQDLDVARALGNVAMVCDARDDRRLATKLVEGALPVLEASLGAAHPEVALMLYNIAEMRGSREGYEKVEPLLRRVLAIQDATLAPGHPERVMPLLVTGQMLARTGRYEEAGSLLDRALSVALQVQGRDGAKTQLVLASQAELAVMLSSSKAEPILLKAVEAAEKNPTAKPYDVAVKLTMLCRHYFVRGKAKSSEPHYRKLRAIAEKLGDMEQGVLRAEMGIPGKTYLLLQQDRGAEAEKMLTGELEVMERVLPAGHGDLLRHLYFTGNIYRMMGRHKDAARLFERYAAAERKLAEADPGRSDGLTRLLDAQLELGQKKDAERTAAEIARLTGKPPVMDPALNEFERQLRSVWHMLKLDKAPDLIGAALKGDMSAGLVVGLCFAAGQGVPRNLDRARPWFEAAAKAGHPTAVKILGALRGAGNLPLDFELIALEAKNWVERSR